MREGAAVDRSAEGFWNVEGGPVSALRYEKTKKGKKKILAHNMGDDRDGVASVRPPRENPQTDCKVLNPARRALCRGLF